MRRFAIALALVFIAGIVVAENCPKCKRELEKGWRYCPGCGGALPDPKKAIDDASVEVYTKKRELLEALKRLKAALEDGGDTEKAAAVAAEIEKIDGLRAAADPGAGTYAGTSIKEYEARVTGRTESLRRGGSTAEMEIAVNAGLRWLARHQSRSGAWSSASFRERCCGKACAGDGYGNNDAGVTGLALLAFLGAGVGPADGEIVWSDALMDRKVVAGAVVRKGLEWLLSVQKESGYVGEPKGAKSLYNHAIATLALCEAYGMSGAAKLKAPAQKAVDYLIEAQNPYSGWRYTPRGGDSDSSVTSWAVSALHAARLSGLTVGLSAFEGGKLWYTSVTDESYGRTGYTAKGTGKVVVAGKNEGFDDNPALTAAAIAAFVRLGVKRPVPSSIDLVTAEMPSWAKSKVDLYYWFHGSEAVFLDKGAKSHEWTTWSAALAGALVPHQRKDADLCLAGSWDPDQDRWGFEGGRVYTTAIALLSLETCCRDRESMAEEKPKKK